MKVADYVISFIQRDGVKEVFVVYGAANGDLIDAFTRNQDINYVCTMHEQGGGFAAEGYVKGGNRYGVTIATSGPGGMNLVTPIGNCYYDSVPCLFITGQINSKFLRPDPSIRQVGFQETDIVGIVKPITKYAKMVTKPEDIRYELEKALFHMFDGRPGPVLLDLPLDVQKAEIKPGELESFQVQTVNKFAVDVHLKCSEFLNDLKNAKKPVLMIGGGARGCDIDSLTHILKIPAFPTWNALDIVTSDMEYYGGRIGTYGGPGRNFGIQNCDLLLAIGSRISGRITGGNIHSFARGAKKYVVDVDDSLLQRKLQQVPFDVNILCDSYIFTEKLIHEAKNTKGLPDFSKWVKRCIEWREKYDPVKQEFFDSKEKDVHPYAFARILSELASPNDIIVADCGGNIVVMNHAFKTKKGQRYFTNNGNSPMGFSMCGAIGAWFARSGPHSPYRNLPKEDKGNVICIIGDGGMTMNIQELSTIKNYGVNVKVFVMNNHVYGITKAFQETNFEGRSEACGPKGYNPPDFTEIAKAYGIKTRTLGFNQRNLQENIIKDVLGEKEAVVCDVICHDFHSYYPKISGWKTPIEDMEPYLPRQEFKSNMSIEPLKGWENCNYS